MAASAHLRKVTGGGGWGVEPSDRSIVGGLPAGDSPELMPLLPVEEEERRQM